MCRQVTGVMVVEQVEEWPLISQINQGYHLPIKNLTNSQQAFIHIEVVQQPPIQLGAVHPTTIQPTAVQ